MCMCMSMLMVLPVVRRRRAAYPCDVGGLWTL